MTHRVTRSTKNGWTKTDRYTYCHVSGLRVIRNVNTNRWTVAGASANDGAEYKTLWLAMYAANKTAAEWA
jgi:hypothetical protein